MVNIISLFVEDHERIASLLKDFKKHKHENTKKVKDIFKQLQQALIDHFHQEEILYSKYKHKTGEIIPALQTIGKEHIIILEKLGNIQKSLIHGETNINISGLYTLLERHKNIEDRLLYPEFDRVLSDKEKEDVYWKIKVR
jgi:hemerythrin